MAADIPQTIPPDLNLAINRVWKQSINGIVQSKNFSRNDRESLQRAGYLNQIMRGWYSLSSPWSIDSYKPDEHDVFKTFLAVYLNDRLGDRWCLSALSSLEIFINPGQFPEQIVILSDGNSTTTKTFSNSLTLTIYPDSDRIPVIYEPVAGLRLMPLAESIFRLPASVWISDPQIVSQAIVLVKDWHQIAWNLACEGRLPAANRLIAQLTTDGNSAIAGLIQTRMLASGYKTDDPSKDNTVSQPVPEIELEQGIPLIPIPAPFATEVDDDPIVAPTALELTSAQLEHQQDVSPVARKLRFIWENWAPGVREVFGSAIPGRPALLSHLANIQSVHLTDTRNSLLLSAYDASNEYIVNALTEPERAAASAGWPQLENSEKLLSQDHQEPLPGDIDPMAAVAVQGYLDAFRLVKRSIVRLLEAEPVEKVLRQDMRGWYSAMMFPSAQAGLLSVRQLHRYRTTSGFCQQLEHTPVKPEDIVIAMETLVQLIGAEPFPAARGLLGLLGLTWIQPWTIGNGRMARFLMNVLRAAGGLSWLTYTRPDYPTYQAALKAALVQMDSRPMAHLLSGSYNGDGN